MWSTQNQHYTFSKPIKDELNAYITALLKVKNGKALMTGGVSDHMHLLMLLSPEIALSDLLSHVKAYSSKWLRSNRKVPPDFSWQTGYLAMSTENDRLDNVSNYMKLEESRHQSQSYQEELLWFLQHQKMDYNPKYFMENSHSKVYVHTVWSTNNRTPFLEKSIRNDLYGHMHKTISDSRGILHEVGGVEDHVHLLIEMPKDKALSDFIRTVKNSSTHWLKAYDLPKYRNFEWQTGFGGFTVSLSRVEGIKHYIRNQEEHHRTRTFDEEWKSYQMNFNS